MRISLDNAMAIAIDFQEKLMPAMEGGFNLQNRSKILFEGLKTLKIPTIVTQQYTKGIGMTVPAIRDIVGEEYFDKRAFSCYRDPDILAKIKEIDRKFIIIAGIEAHICVLQSCLDLLEAGYKPILISDCTASRKKNDMDIAIARLAHEGVIISTSEAILFELMESATHPAFKEISKLIK